MKMYDKAIKVEKLRKQGHTFEEIGKEIGGTRQYAHQLYANKEHFRKDSKLNKIEALLRSLEIDVPVFISNGARYAAFYTIASMLEIAVVTKSIEREGTPGLWVCRYQ